MTAGLVAAAWWLHATRPHWWLPLAVLAGVAAWAVALFGARWRFPTLIERVYAAITIYAAGVWISAATAVGPFLPPLPQALANRRAYLVGAVVGASAPARESPGRAQAASLARYRQSHRACRGRSHVRHRRRVGVARPVPAGTRPDHHPTSSRKSPRSNPGWGHSGARCGFTRHRMTWPTGARSACWTWTRTPGPFRGPARPSPRLLSRSIWDHSRTLLRAWCPLPGLHGIFGGTTGSGKSGGLNVLMGNLVACRDVVIWAIDLKKGMELGPWQSCIDRLATTPEEAITLLRDAVAVLEARAALLASVGKRTWEISPHWPALVIIIDEYAELADEAPDAMSDTDSIARLGRAVAVTLIAATQRPTQKAMGQGAVRSQMDLRICFRVREPRDVDLVLGQGMLRAGWDAHNLNAPGKFLVSAPGPRPAEAGTRLPAFRRSRRRHRRALRP